MADAPSIASWSIIKLTDEPYDTYHFVGIVRNDPRFLEGRRILTSPILFISEDASWARTLNTRYRLLDRCSELQFVSEFESQVRTYLECSGSMPEELIWVSLETWRAEST
jgi:hypothetical protein